VLPSSALEGHVWDKEAEVDRFRERVPLPNLVSQCRQLSSSQKSRDWLGAVKNSPSSFQIIPQCKRSEPLKGTLYKRYDVSKLVDQFVCEEAVALSVNCDGILFGCSLDDIVIAREQCPTLPILASDLILYPYQLYKLRLAGADAVTLCVGALAQKDLLYLVKIAKSIGIQTLLEVTSQIQIASIFQMLSSNDIDCLLLSNRNLETFGFDETGNQVLQLLQSSILQEQLKNNNIHLLVQGQVGLIQGMDQKEYIQLLKKGGVSGAIVGSALALKENVDSSGEAFRLLQHELL